MSNGAQIRRIHENETLWKYYCYWHKDEKETPHPRNICKYIRGAVFGYLTYANTHTSLWVLNGILALSIALNVLFFEVLSTVTDKEPDGIALILVASLMLFLLLSAIAIFMYTFFANLNRFGAWFWRVLPVKIKNFLKSICPSADSFGTAMGIGMCVALVGALIYGFLTKPFGEVLSNLGFLGMILGGVIAAYLVCVVLYLLIKDRESLKSLLLFLKAKKERFCHLVEPPKSTNVTTD